MSKIDADSPAVSKADTNQHDRPSDGPWQSTDLLEFNGIKVRHRIMQDAEARWHTHRGSAEFFLILSGEVTIDIRRGEEISSHTLRQGQMLAVHPGNEHRARCKGRATLVVMDAIERLG